MERFEDLDVSGIKDKLVILDIDGTLVSDSGGMPSPIVADKVSLLHSRNKVFLLSNKKLRGRDAAIAASLGVQSIETRYKKPNPRVLEGVIGEKGALLVIGDKFLTDGLLARRLGAAFVKVARVLDPRDARSARLYYLIDDIAYACYKFFT